MSHEIEMMRPMRAVSPVTHADAVQQLVTRELRWQKKQQIRLYSPCAGCPTRLPDSASLPRPARIGIRGHISPSSSPYFGNHHHHRFSERMFCAARGGGGVGRGGGASFDQVVSTSFGLKQRAVAGDWTRLLRCVCHGGLANSAQRRRAIHT
jgi:hypothetical protein